MPVFCLNYEPAKAAEGHPWGIEEAGKVERQYTGQVLIEVPSRCVHIPDTPRGRGYLLVRGELEFGEDVSRITEERSG